MRRRPLVLLGSEPSKAVERGNGIEFRFDGVVGIWCDPTGRPAFTTEGMPGTTKTATREGTDETDAATPPSTLITETREGTDQSEVTE